MNQPEREIWNEYETALRFKNSLGRRGLAEQAKVNERFYIGDQWYGAQVGKERPLVRHNIIKRIGEYKISQILSDPVSINFKVAGIPDTDENDSAKEITEKVNRLTKHFTALTERLKLQNLNEQILRNAYVSGTGVLYTYWDTQHVTGMYANQENSVPIRGDIACEVLDIADVYFADPYGTDLQKQPYIILKTCRPIEEVLGLAEKYGTDERTRQAIREEAIGGKIKLLTKLYQEYKKEIGRYRSVT